MQSLKRYAAFVFIGSAILIGCDSTEANNADTTFFVSFGKEVLINEVASALICGGSAEYTVGHPTYVAQFESVDGASSYTGRILRKDDTYAAEMALSNVTDVGGGNLQYAIGVGPIVIFKTCNQAAAQTEQQNRLDAMDDVGHQGVEITAVL